MVAPVVVRPEIDSNIESVTERSGVSERIKGTLPLKPRPTQNRTTTMKPSRRRNSFLILRTGNQRIRQQLIVAFDDMGLEFIPSKGNFICVDFEQPADDIYQALLKAGVIVRPLANYGMPNHLRVSIGQEFENTRFINELGRILSE